MTQTTTLATPCGSVYCVSVIRVWICAAHLFFGGAHAHDLLYNWSFSFSHILETQNKQIHSPCWIVSCDVWIGYWSDLDLKK